MNEMSLSSYIPCCIAARISPQVKSSWNATLHSSPVGTTLQSVFAFESINTGLSGRRASGMGSKHELQWSFISGSEVLQTKVARTNFKRKGCSLSASCFFTSSQIASHAFTWGTVAVLPFYTLMVLAPNAELTRRAMESSIPYVALGILYTYLLYLSWSPETLRLMFASKYWLPELPGIAKMFSSQITVASAWIHLLAVDLFAARQVFYDGLKNNVETRHSISLCLLFCPVGIATHVITKLVTQRYSWLH